LIINFNNFISNINRIKTRSHKTHSLKFNALYLSQQVNSFTSVSILDITCVKSGIVVYSIFYKSNKILIIDFFLFFLPHHL
jgi:hypothetical protein